MGARASRGIPQAGAGFLPQVLARARLLVGCTLPSILLGTNAQEIRLGPPSSLEPGRGSSLLAFDHSEQRARQCSDDDRRCWPRFVRRAVVSELRIEVVPIPEPRLGRKDERHPGEVTIPRGRTPGRADLRLAPGEWELRAPLAHARRVRLRDGEKTTIRVHTFIGWCVPDGRQCLFDPNAVRRWIQPPGMRRW